MTWTQVYDPLHSWILSTLVAALPILVLFGMLAGLRVKPHWCAIGGAATAVLVAVAIFGMPVQLAGMSFLYGVAFGVVKIAWIVLAAVYLYDISVHTGQFEIMKESVAGITPDRRPQLLIVAFCFGAFIEGAAGFGAPVAIAGAFMIGPGFKPFHAAALNLLAHTSPVAWGAIRTPAHRGSARQGLDAVRHPLGLRARMGSAHRQGSDEQSHHSGLGRALPAPRGDTRRAGRDQTHPRSGAIRFQLALGNRHRVLLRRDRRRPVTRGGAGAARQDLLVDAQAHEAGGQDRKSVV